MPGSRKKPSTRPTRKPPETETALVPIEDEDAPLPWEKQRGEPAKAFHAFQMYRDLAEKRSLTKVGEIGVETRSFSKHMVDRWSPKWRWAERVDAWDRDQDRKRTAEAEEARSRARASQALAGSLAMRGVIERLRGAEGERLVVALDPNEIEWGDLPSLATAALKLQQAGTGDTPIDLKGTLVVRGETFQSFAGDVLRLCFDAIRETGLAVFEMNGSASLDDVERFIMRRQDALLDEADAMFKRALRT